MRARLAPVAVAMALAAGAAGIAGFTPSPPPPTPQANGSPSPYPSALHTPPSPAGPPRLSAAAAVLEDLDTGQLLFAKRPNAERPVASLTKIMTATIVLERTRLSALVTVSREAASVPGSALGLVAGERISVADLLVALLLQSSNDAAVALAEHVAGSVPAFVARMNARAAALGMRHSHFESPNGLDDRGYSTAFDLALLTRHAERLPRFAAIVRMREASIPAPSGPPRHVQSRNALLWLYPGATGVKTGFTTAAGHALVATAEAGSRRLLAVVLGAPGEAFSDAAALLNHGFAAFSPVELVHEGQVVGRVPVEGRPLPAVAAADVVRLIPVAEIESVGRRLVPSAGLHSPLAGGDPVGVVELLVGERIVGRVTAVAARPIEPPPLWRAPLGVSGPAAEAMRVLALLMRAIAPPFLYSVGP